jgi:serine/threonine protein kinase
MTDTQALVAGRYRILRTLGAGGMGRVWLAHDEVLHREVAIKEIVLPFGLPDPEREELRLRTLREARAAARLSHPNVVQIYDVQSGDEQPWIVMEYVHSRSLLQVIEENGALPVEEVAGIGLAVLSALDAANRVGVLHRDVKPSNVLIADDGRVVLTDFGSALVDGGEGAITRTGVILGSPQYIAPERVDTGVSSPEADLWSLGATLYAAVEGRPPYTRSTTLRSLIAITTDKPDPTRLAGPLKPVLTGLLQHNPKARMKPAEVEQRLRQLADVQTTVHLRHVPPPRKPEPEPEPVAGGPELPELRSSRPIPIAGAPAGLRPERGPGSGPAVEHAAVAIPADGVTTAVRRNRRLVAAAVAAVALLSVGVAAQVAYHPNRSTAAQLANATTTVGAAPSQTTATQASPTIPAATRSSAGFVLPDRFRWWTDKTGYKVAWPAKWTHQRETPAIMFFCAPGGPPTLRVRVWDDAGPDLLAALVQEERASALPAYRRIKIAPVAGAAGQDTTWEYEFTDPKAGRLHGLEHAFVANGHTYLIQWRAAPAKWAASQKDRQVVMNSFRPGA